MYTKYIIGQYMRDSFTIYIVTLALKMMIFSDLSNFQTFPLISNKCRLEKVFARLSSLNNQKPAARYSLFDPKACNSSFSLCEFDSA